MLQNAINNSLIDSLTNDWLQAEVTGRGTHPAYILDGGVGEGNPNVPNFANHQNIAYASIL